MFTFAEKLKQMSNIEHKDVGVSSLKGTPSRKIYIKTSTEAVYNPEGVTQEYINNHVDGSKIVDGTVTTGKIANGAVSMNKLDNETQTLIQRGADSSWTPKGDFNIETTYDANDVVFDPVTNSSYLSLRADNTGHPVDENDEEYEEGWWMKVLDGSYVNRAIEEMEAAIAQAIEDAQEDIDDAIAGANTAAQTANTAAANAEAKIDWVEEQVESLVAYEVADELDEESIIPVQNKVVTDEINRINDGLYYEKNATFGTLVNGFAIRSNGKWEASNRSNTYSCYVHEVKEGDIYLLKVPDAEGSRIHYAFLTTFTQPVQSQDAPFVTGTSLNFGIIAGEKIRITIPSTCKFLYIAKVYANIYIEPEYIHQILPDKDVIDNAIKEYGDILYYHTDAVNLSTLDIVSGVTININSGLWVVTPNASSVFLENDGFDVIKIVPNSNSSMIAFLTSNSVPSVSGGTPDYCDGYDNAIRIEYEQYINLPSDCKFVWLYNAYADTSYLPQSIGLVRSVAAKITDFEKAGGGTLLTKVKGIRCIAPTMNVVAATSYMVEVNPCQKVKITGATGFMWLKTDNIQIGSNPYEASDYFRGWCECDSNGVTLYAAPDCHYLMVDTNVDVYGYDEYKDFEKHDSDLTSLLAYISNRSVRFLYHQFVRQQFGGGYKASLTGVGTSNVHTHRSPACLANNITLMLKNPRLDLGLIGTSRYSLLNQVIRYMQALVDSYPNWSGYWQTSLTTAKLGETAYILKDEIPLELYNGVKAIVEAEANILLNMQDGHVFNDGYVFHLYWKNAQGVELVDGDSKSEEVGWYASCLGMAALMCTDSANHAQYKSKFVEWCVISQSIPDDINSDKVVSGYPLSNLQGSNITNDGIVINHHIIHPNYMASINCVFFCIHAYVESKTPIPKACRFNMDVVSSGYLDYEFTSAKYLGKYQPIPPYGTIIKPADNNVYYPQGNDWGTELVEAEATYLVYCYTMGIRPKYDCSRSATILFERVCALQDRGKSGIIVINSTENRYDPASMAQTNCASTMDAVIRASWFTTHNLRWTDDDWYNIE